MRVLYIVHWPGQDVLVCGGHYQQLKGLANHMGWWISAEPYEGEDVECKNCEHVAAKQAEGGK